MKKCMKLENKWKRRGIKVLPALEDKNLAKDLKENDKNLLWPLDQSKRERIVFENIWKSDEHMKLKVFKKLSMRISIDRKLGLIDRKCLRLIQQRLSTNWNTQNQIKFLFAILIGRETSLIDRNSGKNNFLKNKAILCKNSSKHNIL